MISTISRGWVVAAWIVLCSLAHAQVTVDRELSGFALLPAGTDVAGDPLYEISASFHVSPSGASSVPVDASTLVEISVAGVVVQSVIVDIELDAGSFGCVAGPPCSGGCGSGSADGVAFTLLCGKELPCNGTLCSCECRSPAVTAAAIAHCSLGDEVCVTLSPFPGSAPDAVSANDVACLDFDGEASFHQRRIDTVSAQLSSVAPGTSDLTVEGSVIWNAIPLPAIDRGLEVVGRDASGVGIDRDSVRSFGKRSAGLDLIEGFHGGRRGSWRRGEGAALTKG